MDPSLVSDQNKAWKILLSSIVGVVIATSAVTLRLIARIQSDALLWWDDWTIVMSLFVCWGMGLLRWISVNKFYLGHHVEFVGLERLESFHKFFLGIQALYHLTSMLTKMSILLLFNRIFGQNRTFRITFRVTTFFVISSWFLCTFFVFWGCTPFEKMWDESLHGSCIDLIAFFKFNGVADVLLNILILLLPLPMVWKLDLPLRQRLEMTSIFLVGSFVCFASVMRILSYNSTQLHDITYSGVEAMSWSMIEQALGIVCACLVVFRFLLLSCCQRRWRRRRYEATINSFGIQIVDSQVLNGQGIPEADQALPATPNCSIDERETITTAETIPRPDSALIGVAISSCIDECSPKDGHCWICSASRRRAEQLQSPITSDSPPLIPLTAHIAAFKEQTRGLGQPRSNFF